MHKRSRNDEVMADTGIDEVSDSLQGHRVYHEAEKDAEMVPNHVYHRTMNQQNEFTVADPATQTNIPLVCHPEVFERWEDGWQISNRNGEVAALLSTDKQAYKNQCRQKKKEVIRQLQKR